MATLISLFIIIPFALMLMVFTAENSKAQSERMWKEYLENHPEPPIPLPCIEAFLRKLPKEAGHYQISCSEHEGGHGNATRLRDKWVHLELKNTGSGKTEHLLISSEHAVFTKTKPGLGFPPKSKPSCVII
jgi:hypothetical protein